MSGKVVIPRSNVEGEHRLVLVHESLLREWLERTAEARNVTLVVDWREPRTERITYYEPSVTSIIEAE